LREKTGKRGRGEATKAKKRARKKKEKMEVHEGPGINRSQKEVGATAGTCVDLYPR